ncbi:hypothetical protein ACHQM5_028680 [Ranunculus cassubicifolius]
MASTKIVSEYAKSGRSSCKKCSNPISAKTLRLGSITKGPGGFDMTKWYHFNCFSTKFSVENIQGFSTLQTDDQESLKTLAKQLEENQEKVSKKSGNKLKRKAHEIEDGKVEEISVEEVDIVLSESDVKRDYKGIELIEKWKSFQTVIFLEKEEGLKDSSKIAAFDFDGCLAKTDVRKHGAEAWEIMYPSIPEKLRKLYEDGYKVVIFTNEANIERWKNKRQAAIDSKIGRLTNFIECVGIPVQVFIACGHGGEDAYRKPKVGMWRLMEKYYNSGIKVDMDESFYVGDAAGRKGDHSDADIKFARIIGLKFHLPEDYFGA